MTTGNGNIKNERYHFSIQQRATRRDVAVGRCGGSHGCAAIPVFNIEDPGWIQMKYVQAIQDHRDDDIRGLALTCIGHVARMHKVIDEALVIPVLLENLKHKTLAGIAQDALDDIEIFINR